MGGNISAMGGSPSVKYRDMKVIDVNAIQYDCELIKQSTEVL